MAEEDIPVMVVLPTFVKDTIGVRREVRVVSGEGTGDGWVIVAFALKDKELNDGVWNLFKLSV